MDSAAVSTRATPAPSNGRSWTPLKPEEVGRLLPGCEVLSLLGTGGMGTVYLALQTALDRSVAIKVLPLENSADEAFSRRFTSEARTMARLNHPHIVPVYESGRTAAGHLYFVMEFVDGANLQTLIHGPLGDASAAQRSTRGVSVSQALDIAAQVCDALSCAHREGVVHRDIKPANIMVDLQGRARVADFGIARITDPAIAPFQSTLTGTIVGTPDYIAPEQMRGEHVDHRADIYSVGVMLYEMLCGEVPRGVFAPPSRRSGCPQRIDRIVNRALQPEPALRYQSAVEMKADLESAQAQVNQLASRSPRPLFLLLGVAVVLVAVASLYSPKKAGRLADARTAKRAAAAPAGKSRSEDANRQLAEWMLSVGDSRTFLNARMAGSGALIRIDAKEKIPSGKWDVVEVWFDRSVAPPGLSPVTERDFLLHMSGLRYLERFFIRDIPLSELSYTFLAQNPNLTSVVIERAGVTDAVLRDLEGLRNLKVLTINTSVAFTGRGLEKLACLPGLEDAIFYWTGCGDAVAEVLSTCPRLRQAHLERTMLSDAGLAKLAKVASLKKINLGGCLVTDGGLAAFRQALPECEILR